MHKGGDPAGAILITGTDTGVGKTVVTALLASCLLGRRVNTGVMKPVASGCDPVDGGLRSNDALFFKERLGLSDPVELISPVCFREPLAPAVAARLEGRELDLDRLDVAYESLRRRYDILLVEGIGGLLVPLTGRFTVCDLALRWDIPILIVARPGLGTINHTALTVECARSRGARVAGIIFNASRPLTGDKAEETNAACIEALCGVPCWGTIPYGGPSPGEAGVWDGLCGEADRIVASRLMVFTGKKPYLSPFS